MTMIKGVGLTNGLNKLETTVKQDNTIFDRVDRRPPSKRERVAKQGGVLSTRSGRFRWRAGKSGGMGSSLGFFRLPVSSLNDCFFDFSVVGDVGSVKIVKR